MAQQPIEMILARQFADHLAIPMIVLDPEGTAVFWNEPAEHFTGMRFDEHGPIPREVWLEGWQGRDGYDNEIPLSELPPVIALDEQRPARLVHKSRLFSDKYYEVDVSALPIVGQQDRFCGVLVSIWSVR